MARPTPTHLEREAFPLVRTRTNAVLAADANAAPYHLALAAISPDVYGNRLHQGANPSGTNP